MITGCRKLCEQMNELEVKVEMVTTFSLYTQTTQFQSPYSISNNAAGVLSSVQVSFSGGRPTCFRSDNAALDGAVALQLLCGSDDDVATVAHIMNG